MSDFKTVREGLQVADRRRWQSAMTSPIGDVGSERVKWRIIFSVQFISIINAFKCSIKSMKSMFNLRRFSERMENYEIYIMYIFVPNFQNLEFTITLICNIESLTI